MRIVRVTYSIGVLLFVAACSEEPPPISVNEFMENPRLLEATMVRCGQNRSEMKYEVECVNARDAINRIERAEERARRAELERQSERKRQALRRTQEAAAAARQRAVEEQRRREEAEYLAIFEELPPEQQAAGVSPVDSNVAQPANQPGSNPPGPNMPRPPVNDTMTNSPQATTEMPVEEPVVEPEPQPASDLDAIREELKRRQEPPNPR